MVKLDPASDRVLNTYRIGLNPFGVACDASGVWVANYGSDSLSVIPIPPLP
jgi:DNA-binding beta-propeller fold protein YncE